jgi:hypothetical protein
MVVLDPAALRHFTTSVAQTEAGIHQWHSSISSLKTLQSEKHSVSKFEIQTLEEMLAKVRYLSALPNRQSSINKV